MKIKVEEKKISGEVSVFCLWTNWIHLVTCRKIEFRELYYRSYWALDKIYEIYTFDRCPHGWSSNVTYSLLKKKIKENFF